MARETSAKRSTEPRAHPRPTRWAPPVRPGQAVMTKTLRILGTRGCPSRPWRIRNFCRAIGALPGGPRLAGRGLLPQRWRGGAPRGFWQAIERVHIPVSRTGPAGTVVFDWLATRHAARHRDLCLTLGYNTGVFSALLRWRGVPNLINMDGIEWSRAKWGPAARAWLWVNDWAACWLANHLVPTTRPSRRICSRA